MGDGYVGGSAQFIALGDKLVVCDRKNGDGYGAGAWLRDVDTGKTLESVYDGVPDGTCDQLQCCAGRLSAPQPLVRVRPRRGSRRSQWRCSAAGSKASVSDMVKP